MCNNNCVFFLKLSVGKYYFKVWVKDLVMGDLILFVILNIEVKYLFWWVLYVIVLYLILIVLIIVVWVFRCNCM